jgi:hypothetical protein
MDRYSRKIRPAAAKVLKIVEDWLARLPSNSPFRRKPKNTSDWPVDADGVHYYTHHSASRGRRYS